MGLFDWFSSLAPSAAEVRAEVWKLGVRHRGEPLEGALAELRDSANPPARVALLRACVHQLRQA
ncbi:hypothetical protein [Phenylobacterium sp.]|uniref:hypothetical protein n=1 Tax=Phenylobacterium sp. TaxID=1871053 RepID=UPI002DE8FA84|nr:hypothetical protein [Phenylobacterium sp.]